MKEINLEELQHSFEQAYNEQVKELNILKRNNVYLIETMTDKYVLKCFTHYSIISWQDKFLNQMVQKGTKGIVPFIKNKNQMSINCLHEDTIYYGVMPFIPGEAIDFNKNHHVTDCMKLLGQFHAFGSAIYGKQQMIPFRSHIFERWNDRLHLFQRSLNQINDQEQEVEGLIPFVKAYGKNAMEWATWTMNHFPQAYMLYLEEQTQWERQIAHLDVAPHNFLTLDNNQYYILDYDLVDYSPPLMDIVQYINRVLPYHQWSFELVWELIHVYEYHYPLQRMQKKILPILLVYPNDFFREWIGLWKRHHGYHPNKVYDYFHQLEKEWNNRRRFVQQCMSMLQ